MAQVLLFARARELAGRSHDVVEGDTVKRVVSNAARAYGPEFIDLLGHCAVMLDGEHVRDFDLPVTDASEVAILPPVSGGSS